MIQMDKFSYNYIVNVSYDINGNSMIRRIWEQKIADGFLFVADDLTSNDMEFLSKNKIPYVFTGIEPPSCFKNSPYVLFDEIANGALVTQYLLNLGFKNIYTITNKLDRTSYFLRTQGYIETMCKAGKEPKVLHHSMETDRTSEILDLYMDEILKADVLYVQWDGIAGVLMQMLEKRRISIPNNLSIIGHNDYNIGWYFYPKLTTLRDPITQCSHDAISYLIGKINNPSHPIIQKRIEGIIIERESVLYKRKNKFG